MTLEGFSSRWTDGVDWFGVAIYGNNGVIYCVPRYAIACQRLILVLMHGMRNLRSLGHEKFLTTHHLQNNCVHSSIVLISCFY